MWRKSEEGKIEKIGLGKTSALYEFPLRVCMLFSSNLYYSFRTQFQIPPTNSQTAKTKNVTKIHIIAKHF